MQVLKITRLLNYQITQSTLCLCDEWLFSLTLPNRDARLRRRPLMKIHRLLAVLRALRLVLTVPFLLLIVLAMFPVPASAVKKIIFDTDPGTDDALALM